MEIKKCPFCGGIGELTMDEKKVIETTLTEYENEQFQHLGSVVTNMGYSDWATTAIDAGVKEVIITLATAIDGKHGTVIKC